MFQQQRRGLDELNRAMLITALVLSLLGMPFAPLGSWLRYLFTGLSAVLLVLMVVRMTSKNTAKRYQENLQYLRVATQIETGLSTHSVSRSAGAKTTQSAPDARAKT
ncbi:MAG: hypothetical protein R2912_07725 [Eubacteriales bacterium]